MSTMRLQTAFQHLCRVELGHDPHILPDVELLERFVARKDHVAFETLLRRHGPMVYGVCCRVLDNPHDIEEAFQATFLVFVRKAATLRSGGVLSNWLYGVAFRTSLKARATALRRRARFKQVEAMPDVASAESVTDDDWRDLLDAELHRLPDNYRSSVLLCDVQGLTRREAAGRLSCPEGTVSTWLSRGRALLARRLSQRGVTLSLVALFECVRQEASACLPTPLVASLLQAGTATSTVGVSMGASALASAVVRSLFLEKLRLGALVILALGILVGGIRGLATGGQSPAVVSPTADPARPLLREAPRFLPRAGLDIKNASGVALSDDGRTLAISNSLDRITLWDLTCDAPIGELTAQGSGLSVLAFSPDGTLLACGGDENLLELWDVRARKKLAAFKKKGADSRVISLAFAPDGMTLAAGDESETITLLDVTTRKPVAVLPFKDNDVDALAFSPDGRTLAAAGQYQTGCMIVLFDVEGRKEIGRLEGHKGRIKSLAYSRDGKTLVCGGTDRSIQVWDLARRRVFSTLTGHENRVTGVAFLPDGTLISASRDRTLRYWDVGAGKQIGSEPTITVGSLGLSRDGRVLVTGGVSTQVWDRVGAAPDGGGDAKKIPDGVRPPRGHIPLATMQAEGFQIYVSEATGKGFQWKFKAPLADLILNGKREGFHYAGPSWELKGGCKVVRDAAEAVREAPSPNGAGNLNWLLIKLQAEPGNKGRLMGATYVQRIHTEGGVPPSEAPLRAGTEIGVRYRATYQFFKKLD